MIGLPKHVGRRTRTHRSLTDHYRVDTLLVRLQGVMADVVIVRHVALAVCDQHHCPVRPIQIRVAERFGRALHRLGRARIARQVGRVPDGRRDVALRGVMERDVTERDVIERDDRFHLVREGDHAETRSAEIDGGDHIDDELFEDEPRQAIVTLVGRGRVEYEHYTVHDAWNGNESRDTVRDTAPDQDNIKQKRKQWLSSHQLEGNRVLTSSFPISFFKMS